MLVCLPPVLFPSSLEVTAVWCSVLSVLSVCCIMQSCLRCRILNGVTAKIAPCMRAVLSAPTFPVPWSCQGWPGPPPNPVSQMRPWLRPRGAEGLEGLEGLVQVAQRLTGGGKTRSWVSCL